MGRHEVVNSPETGAVTWCQGPPFCPQCNQEEAAAAFHEAAGTTETLTCPSCGYRFAPPGQEPVRATESVDTTEATTTKAPYGDVTYADPGYQADKKKRYPLDTEEHIRAAWTYINQADNAAKYSSANLKTVKGRIRAAMKRIGAKVTEAVIDGERSFDDVRDLVRDALAARAAQASGDSYCWVYIADLTTTQVVYAAGGDDLYQCSYALGDDGSVTLGDPTEVVRTYAPAGDTSGEPPEPASDDMAEADVPPVVEEAARRVIEATGEQRDVIVGRVIEAKGTDETGGRVFGVRIIAYGDSKNNRRYNESVLRSATPLYEGAKAYDHHRTDEELRSSTITGLVGYYRDVQAEADGLYGDLHLLPSATHTAEALDATIAAQQEGLPPLVGISHDVSAYYTPIVDGGRRLQEATSIAKVNSADVVADPAAGGQAIRMVAGGADRVDPDPTHAGTDPAAIKEAQMGETAQTAPASAAPNYTLEQVLALLRTASPAQLAEATGLAGSTAHGADNGTPVVMRKDSWNGQRMVRDKVTDAGLPLPTVEAIHAALPDRITEADVDAHIVAIKASLGVLERARLAPTAGVKVTKEEMTRKMEALDAFFNPDPVAKAKGNAYHSIKQAYADFTGMRPGVNSFDSDWNREILRESIGGGFDSATRAFESMDSSSWNLVLGDSITRRMVAEYQQPNLQTWRQVVSSIVPVNDFRQQRVDRIGGYGTLPTVNQSAPYQPLTSPTNEEVTYTITKRGGTEDITLEMIANDDVRAISRIPVKLGLAAAQTLFRFVWDILNPGGANAAIYDSTALYHTNHANTASSALAGSALSTIRQKMRAQAAYGDSADVLGFIPRTLVVCNTIEELAWELVTSSVALPSGAPVGAATNIPNLHQGTNLIVIDYWSSTTGWIVVADTTMCPTMEIGFYQGQETPSLFTQADPNYGTVFNADKISYKIRHIYSGAVLDYRGFQRGNS